MGFAQKRPKSVITYAAARSMLGSKNFVKVRNNIYLERCDTDYWSRDKDANTDDCIAVKLYDTQIIRIRPNNTWQLFMGGYDTPTTRFRIFEYSPAVLFRGGNAETYLSNVTYDARPNDPIRELIASINSNGGRPALPWIVKWTSTGLDPIRAAWNASKDLLAMIALIEAYGADMVKQLSIPGIDVRKKNKYKFFVQKLKREVEKHTIDIDSAMVVIRKAVKPPTIKEVISSKVSGVYASNAFYEKTAFYEGMIVDASGREVKQ